MSKSLHAIIKVFSENVYFVTVIFTIPGQKLLISASSQNIITEKSIFGHFEVIFLNVEDFLRAGTVISC